MMLEPSMKRFLACLTTAFALCAPGLPVGADEADLSGRVRLSDDKTAPPPIPHVIGSDDTGRAIISGENPPLPGPSQSYMETYAAPNLGYQMGGDVFTVQYRLDQRNGGLWGYDDGYTNIGAFIPRAIDENSLLFWDLRGMVTNNSDGGFNLGFGRRHYDAAADRVYSQSMWLDYDGGHVKQYVQGGLSWAMTSRYWRTRVNANRLLSDTNDFIGTTFDTNPFFGGNNVLIGRERVREVAFNQIDASIGGPIPLLGQFGFNWDFGMYYNTSDEGQDGIGFMAHADANLTEDLLMDVRYTNDDIFGTQAQLSFVFNLPDGRPRRFMRQPRVHDYMLRPEERNYRVSTKQYTIADSVPLLCPTDDSPILVAHVDPFEIDNVVADGDGSFENPFNSSEAWNALSGAEKAQYDIVLVQPGATPDGTLIDNNLNSGFVIVENQRLLASTGQLVRDVDINGLEVYRYAAHTMQANVAELGNGLTFNLPGSEAFAGTIFDPLADPRPILTNDSAVMSNSPLAVVTIDNSFSVACDQLTEVSGFIINGQNPNMPTMLNNGIVTGNMVDPAMGTGVSGFNINSNFIIDTVHGVNITNFGDSSGILRMNRVEGDGFNSNSGMTVTQFDGALLMQVEDNVTYNIFGEDIDNDGRLDIVATGTEDVNGNGKLDIGEDLDGDGVIDLNEDNDKDGLLSSDDIGVGINLIANSAGAGIFAEDTTLGRHIIRNRTYQSEAEYYRQQSLNQAGEVVNTFTARDINGDIAVSGTTITTNSDTDDIVGNKNGINLEAIDGGVFSAYLADNDTSNNNPYAPGLLPTAKNPFFSTAPTPLGNEFGLRTAATGVNSVFTLASPDSHISNNNFGHGYILEGLNGGTVTMLNPMMGAFTTDPVEGNVNSVTPSQFNNNGLNGMLVRGLNGSTVTVLVGPTSTDFDGFTLNQFSGNGADGLATTPGNGIEFVFDDSTLIGSVSHNTVSNNAEDGILFRLTGGTSADGFVISKNTLEGNGEHGIALELVDTPIDGWIISNNIQVGAGGIGGGSNGAAFTYRQGSFADFGTLTNTSNAGIDLVSFNLDLSSVGLLYDTVEPGASSRFQPFFGSDVTTGLTTVNGTQILAGTFPLQDINGNVLVDGGVPDNSTMLDLLFNDFNPQEVFDAFIDLDNVPDIASVPLGNEMIGAPVVATFSNGATVSGVMRADPLNTFGSVFLASAGTATASEFDGINVSATNSNISNARITNNFIAGNGDNGIQFDLANSNLSNALLERNEINNNLGDGVQILNPQFATNALGDNRVIYSLNTITGNGGHGINMALDNSNRLDAIICYNDISSNSLGGINVVIEDNAIYRNGIVTGPNQTDETSWYFGNTVNNNGGVGYYINASDNSQFTLVGSRTVATTMDGNEDAGIGIEMYDNTVGNIRLDNISITGTTDNDNGTATDVNTRFNGDGFGLYMTDSTRINNLRIGDSNPDGVDTNISGNAGNGIDIDVTTDAILFSPIVQNSNISDNTDDNINVLRTGSGRIGDDTSPDTNPPAARFVITGNTINNSVAGTGVHIIARNAEQIDEYLISENQINGNAVNGVQLDTELDAQLDVDILFNEISMNGFDGILTTARENQLTDAESMTGTWIGNLITQNGDDGIDLNAVYGFTTLGVDPLVIGATGVDSQGRSNGNTITQNGDNGIEIGSTAGIANIVNNTISSNGNQATNEGSGIEVDLANVSHTLAINLNRIQGNAQHGVDFNNDAETSPTPGTTHTINATLDSNLITNNGRDGVQILSSALPQNPTGSFTNGWSTVNVSISNSLAGQNSVIRDNGGRGVDILARGRGNANVSIEDTLISDNGEEGVYTVITTSVNQSNEVSSNDPLLQDGGLFGTPTVIFNMNDSIVRNNSQPGGFEGGGLVFRVGTTGAEFGTGNNANWSDEGTVNPFLKGGLVADINNNQMTGNGGIDFLMHTFASTVDPNTTGGAWTDQNEATRNNANDVFNPTGYQQDPLARIQVNSFSGNTGGSADVLGAGLSGSSSAQFAFYDNPEPVFKSRTQNQDNNTDGGPFDDPGPFANSAADRARNATRLASRTGFTTYDTNAAGVTTIVPGSMLPPSLTIIDGGRNSDDFLYPGLGLSTLRVSSSADITLSGFNTVITGFDDEVGVPGGSGLLFFRDTNFLWDTF